MYEKTKVLLKPLGSLVGSPWYYDAGGLYVEFQSSQDETYDVKISLFDGKWHTLNEFGNSLPPDILKGICLKIDGPIPPADVDVDDDLLFFDHKEKMFTCGCKKFDLKKADEIFRYLGTYLGYEIT